MTFDKNKGVRTTTAVDQSDRAAPIRRSRRSTRSSTSGRPSTTRCCCSSKSGSSRGFSARVCVHAVVGARQHQLQWFRRDQLPDRSGPESEPQRRAERLRSPAQPRRQRPHARAVHPRHDLQLGGARAQRAAVHAHQQHHRRRPQRHAVRSDRRGRIPAPARSPPTTTRRTSTADATDAPGPGFFQLDTRYGWRLPLGKGRTLDVSADVFNLTNRANFANPGGNQSAPATFLVLSALRDGAAPRTLQIGARLGF